MKPDIVIYNDEGVGAFGLSALRKFFAGYEVWLCDANAVIDGTVFGLADIFVMPGGADLPYARKLNGQGNANIRRFVEDGGTYLGICAGAYYGCESLEYHKGREDEICQPRELALLPAVAEGSLPALAPYFDNTLGTAAIAALSVKGGAKTQALYQGGCLFRFAKNPNVEVLARYDSLPGKPPAIIRGAVGDGQAILSGVHFEIGADALANHPEHPALAKTLAAQFQDKPAFDWHSFLIDPQEQE